MKINRLWRVVKSGGGRYGPVLAVVILVAGLGLYTATHFFLAGGETARSTSGVSPTPASDRPKAASGSASPSSGSTPGRPVKIWPIGDSLTEGGDANQHDGYRLDLWNELTAAGYSIDFVGDYNYGAPTLPDRDTNGSSGSCILADPCYQADILYNVTKKSMGRLDPDIVIMNGGGNDFCCGHPQDPTRVEGYMQQWIQLIWTISPNAYIVVLGMTGDYHSEYDNWIQQYAAQQAASGKHIVYVSIRDVTTLDTVHPDNHGYQMIADRIRPVLESMINELMEH